MVKISYFFFVCGYGITVASFKLKKTIKLLSKLEKNIIIENLQNNIDDKCCVVGVSLIKYFFRKYLKSTYATRNVRRPLYLIILMFETKPKANSAVDITSFTY